MVSLLDNGTEKVHQTKQNPKQRPKPKIDNDTQPLLTPSFWILPLCPELLNSARRIGPSAASDRARDYSGLVKLICEEQRAERKEEVPCWNRYPNDRGGLPSGLGRAA